ncbi:uncharacterized protein LOC109725803 [Ananas comosus]|uniref:Uncharacterized protein LOC109725803 n=1 Tax=Ananas comosus TaxID=4615 RepID=A0A6P5GSG1_ANACO|nr:uncharacterized protein LOC109725803 [Ananas comosus]
MEALRKLERIQTLLSFIHSRALASNHDDADRFLAHFLLFFLQPSGMLSTERKYSLISELLKKITVEILEEARLVVTDEDYDDTCVEPSFRFSIEDKADREKSKVEDAAVIGFDAMQRANSTLEDFCRSYFMFHGMDANKPQSIFKFLPVLSFTESYIYQLDTLNENNLHPSPEDSVSETSRSDCLIHTSNEIKDQNVINNLHETSVCDPFAPLLSLLRSQGILTDRIRTELKSGIEYWALEKKLCGALTSKTKISIEDAMRAIHLKSFDYRVLNLLLYHLTRQQTNELHMEFLSVSEFLVEVSDDLYDYEEDVINNNFNVLRMFVAVYGASMAPKMLAKCICEVEEKYESLSKTLDPDLSLNYWRRCEEATKEGGLNSGHAYGTWTIPCVIADEDSFRAQSANKKSRGA